MLSASGLKRLEVTSFVRPDVIPQLSDAEEVLGAVQRRDGVSFSVLIPNERGLERALGLRDRFDEINVFVSASETHNRKNVNRSIEESLAGLERTLATRPRGGAALRGRDLDLLRLPLRGRGAAGARLRDRRAARRRRLRRGRLRRHDRDGQPAPGRRVLRRRARAARRGRADRPLPQHPRPGPRQRAGGAGAGRRLLRVELRRARRLPGAARRDRQRRDRGRGLDAARDGDRDRDRPAAPDRGLARRPGGARPPARRPRAPRRPGRPAAPGGGGHGAVRRLSRPNR